MALDPVTKAISAFMDKGNPKEELNYILVDRANNCLVATNTKVLLKMSFDHEGLSAFLDTLPSIKHDQAATLEVIDAKGYLTKINGKYADYERIFPRTLDASRFIECPSFSSHEFARTGVVFDIFNKDIFNPLKVLTEDAKCSAWVNKEEGGHQSPVIFTKDDWAIYNKSSLVAQVKIIAAVMPIICK